VKCQFLSLLSQAITIGKNKKNHDVPAGRPGVLSAVCAMCYQQCCAGAYCCGCPRSTANAHDVRQQHDSIAAAAQQVEMKEPRLRHTPVLQYINQDKQQYSG
jgi:hypothetical protein